MLYCHGKTQQLIKTHRGVREEERWGGGKKEREREKIRERE